MISMSSGMPSTSSRIRSSNLTTTALEAPNVVDGRPDSRGDQRTYAWDAGQAPSGLIGLDTRLDFLAKALDSIAEHVDLLRHFEQGESRDRRQRDRVLCRRAWQCSPCRVR
jgi:hypothetical protein